MVLNNEAWYVRFFFWAVGVLDKFSGKNNSWQYETKGTNLCHFMRVILIWMPLVLLLHLVLAAAVVAAIIVLPLHFFGVGPYFAALAGIAVTVGIIFLIAWMRRERERQEPVERVQAKPSKPEKEKAGPTATEVFWAWIVAQKQKICPLITFNFK